jgi:hypothetical protein
MKLRYVLAALVVASIATWAFVALTFTTTPDGILVLYSKQAKECEEGGGCAIFSQREFEAAVNHILALQRRRMPNT